jgi:competence ComEA-like helix-hairpin-helix protein
MKKILLLLFALSLTGLTALASTAAVPPVDGTMLEESTGTLPTFDLNTVNREELMSIRGIGPALAQRILEYRKRIGAFTSIDDLLEVRGIGTKNIVRFKEYLTLSTPPSPVTTHSPESAP